MPRPSRSGRRPAIEILEEAVTLLRQAPPATALTYLAGAVPFLLAVLFFLSEMTRNPFAQERLGGESLVVAVLFIWKRVWQSIFAARLHEQLSGRGLSRRHLPRLIGIEASLQPLRLVALPISLLMTVPFAGVVAFFRNVGLFTALGEEKPVSAARRQSSLWTGQNWAILGIAAGTGVLLFANILIVLVVLPQLARSFLGIEGEFTRLGMRILNASTVAVAACLTWLAIDPLLEAAYVVRCYYGASVSSGDDLRAALRRATAIAALAVCLIGTPVYAQQPPPPPTVIDSARLDRSIDEVIRRREFTWRAARSGDPETNRHWPGWLQSTAQAIRNFFDWIGEKLKKWFESTPKESRKAGAQGERPPIELFSVAMVLVLVAGCIALFLRRRKPKPADVTPVATAATPVNLADDSVTADQLPESSWLALAEEWLGKGDNRLAMRALYLASLNYLSERGLVSITRSKTGLDYRRELERRSRAIAGISPGVVPVFQQNNALFERGWYGRHTVERQHVENFAAGLDEMRRCARQ